MEALTLAAALLAVVLVVVALVSLRSLRRSVDDLHLVVDGLSAGAATTDDLRAAVAAALDPEVPEQASEPVSRVPRVLRTGPVIKAMAIGSGTAHAARRLRGSAGDASNGRDGH
jgi:hypothetical protein